MEESDEEVLSELGEAQRQVRKLSQDTKIITPAKAHLVDRCLLCSGA